MPLVLDGTNGVSGVDGTASNPAIEGTDSNTGIFYPAADTVAIGTGGTEALRVNSSQNVGIGTSSPASKLQVSNTSGYSTITVTGNAASGGVLSFVDSAGVTTQRILGFGSTAGENTSLRFDTNGSERMRLDASGNLLVGTTTASANFYVYNNPVSYAGLNASAILSSSASQSTGTGGLLAFEGKYTSGGALANFAAIGGLKENSTDNNYAGYLAFYTRANGSLPAERARITSGGAFLVGTTTGQQNTEIAAFTNAGGGSIVLRIQRGGENNAYIGSSTAQPFQVYDSGIVQRFVVTSVGTCLNTTGTYGTLSDAKLKENIVDATPKLDDLMKVKVRNYELKSEPNSKYLGFVAQELREIFPAMIDETEDEDDNGEKTGEVTLSVKTTVFIPMLVKAIQELNAKVEAQAAEIAALKAQP